MEEKTMEEETMEEKRHKVSQNLIVMHTHLLWTANIV